LDQQRMQVPHRLITLRCFRTGTYERRARAIRRCLVGRATFERALQLLELYHAVRSECHDVDVRWRFALLRREEARKPSEVRMRRARQPWRRAHPSTRSDRLRLLGT